MKGVGERTSHAALVVALLALVISMGGIGYAATRIGTDDIENGAVTRKKIHRKAINGAKVVESSLGRVPLARDARTIDGRSIRTFESSMPVDAVEATLLRFHGLRLDASCPDGRPEIEAVSESEAEAKIDVEGVARGSTPGSTDPFRDAGTDDLPLNPDANDAGGGTVGVLFEDGTVMTITLHFLDDRFTGQGDGCLIFGSAIGGD